MQLAVSNCKSVTPKAFFTIYLFIFLNQGMRDCITIDTTILSVGIFHNTLGITLRRDIGFAPTTERICTSHANANKTSFI